VYVTVQIHRSDVLQITHQDLSTPRLYFVVFFFFFSSRRRHTRCLSDWSSDVCSSDLSVGIMRSRIDKLGVAEPEIRKQGSNQIVIELAGVHDAAAAAKLIGKTAQLQFFDFEADVTGPSKNLNGNIVATGSLYDLLKQVQGQ